MVTDVNEKITIVLVNYNGRNFLKNCIESIRAQTYNNISLLIVDNNSSDDSVNYLKSTYPEIPVIVCSKNHGFAKGNNIGIRRALEAGADYILLLNVDTVIDEHLVEYLMKEADSQTVTVPKIYSDKRMMKIWYSGGEIDYINGRAFHYEKWECSEGNEVSFACGCCILIHKNILERVGMFDEHYYLYFEDTDFSARLAKENIKIKYVKEARMWHKVGGSGGDKGALIKTYYITRNRLYFINKFQDEIQVKALQIAWETFWKYVITEKNKEKRKYVWWGIRDFYRKKMYKLRDGT